MKKTIAVLFALVLAFSALSLTAAAADGYTKVYSVSVAPKCESMITITPTGSVPYAKEGEAFSFTVSTVGDYTFDQTTVIKVVPVSYATDIIKGEGDAAYIVYPDANGVYTISSVTEDMYVYASNLQTGSLASVKDFLFNFFYFIINYIKWFFGLR